MEEDNRKNVNRIKKFIIGFFIALMVIPMVLCILLFVRIGKLEKKIDSYLGEKSEVETATMSDSMTAVNPMTEAEEYAQNENVIRKEKKKQEFESKAKQDADAINSLDKSLSDNGLYKTNSAAKTVSASVTDAATSTDAAVTEATTEAATEEPVLNGHKVYLTFDDGPSIYTDQILDILKEKDVKATFFVVSDDYTYADELNRIVREGHTLGMHSMSHKYEIIYKDLLSFKEDVQGIHDLLYDITGVDTKYYRFPGGSSNTVSKAPIDECINYLDSQGITYFDWNALNGDAEYVTYSAEELNSNVMGYVRANPEDSIVLLHDQLYHGATVEALPDLIDQLKSEGYEIVPIDDSTIPVQHRNSESEEE
jgi:Predicted xylanase/chitin deacetylase